LIDSTPFSASLEYADTHQRDVVACTWTLRHGWTTSTILTLLFGLKRSITGGLVAAGYLSEHPTPPNKQLNTRGYPHKLLTVTASGLEFLASNGVIVDVASVEPIRITESQPLRHDTAVQLFTARSLQLGVISDFVLPKSLGKQSLQGIKEADMLFVETERLHALEVEASRKSNENIINFINKCTSSLQLHGGTCQSIQIVTDDPSIYKLYFLILYADDEEIGRQESTIQTSIRQIRTGITFRDNDKLCVDIWLTPFY
jgi:hypothetical protein